MQSTDIPPKFPKPFAASAGGSYKRAIPSPSQIGIEDGAASLTDGFPPDAFIPRGAGGAGPFGKDFNGLLNQDTAWAWWQAAGGTVSYDSAFSTAVGGYPKYAILASTTPGVLWQSTAENNTTDPDGGSPANWTQITNPVSDAPTFTANAAGYAIGMKVAGIFRYIMFGSTFVSNQTTATITYPVPLTTIGICTGSGGPNSNDDSDIHVVSSGTSSAVVRNSDGSGATFYWVVVGY